jgi:PadR family transcriptional regulator, regulatory protein PadR
MARARRPSPQTVAVLDALAAKPSDWSYGYDLCRALGLKAGTVYPILIRLAERGYVETAWEQEVTQGRPPRHLYRLSTAGAEHVRELRRSEAERTSGRSRVAKRLTAGGGTIAGAEA